MTIIVKPNGNTTYQNSLHQLKAIEPPIWQAILANAYKAETIIDAEADNLNDTDLLNRILHINPDKVIIISSGSHPSAYIQQRDAMIRLDILLTKHKINVESHSTLPFSPVKWGAPDWSLVDLSKYKSHNWHAFSNNNNTSPYGVIYTSLSCPYSCEFCSVKAYYGTTFEQRTLEDIAIDFDFWAKNNTKNIKIMDELFIFNKNRVHLICDNIIANNYDFNIWAYARIDIMDEELIKKMKKAGINWLAFGIETGNEEIRKHVLKGSFDNNRIREVMKMCKDNNMNVIGNYMFGFWDDTLDTMQETLDFAKELNCEYANFYNVVAYPNSKLYDEMLSKGVKLPTSWKQYSQTSEDFLPLSTKYLNYKEVLKFRDNAFNNYYTDSKYLDMIQNKFGEVTIKEIKDMTSIKLIRN